jgi:hypothetical protein
MAIGLLIFFSAEAVVTEWPQVLQRRSALITVDKPEKVKKKH